MVKEIKPGKNPRKSRGFTRNDLLVFAFFLFLSFVFWYLNSLGKDLQTEIKYPVAYTNLPAGWNLGSDTPGKVSIALNGPGYSILRIKLTGRKSPVMVDFSRVIYRRSQNGIRGDYYVVTSNLVNDLNAHLKGACKVTAIKPDTLFLTVR